MNDFIVWMNGLYDERPALANTLTVMLAVGAAIALFVVFGIFFYLLMAFKLAFILPLGGICLATPIYFYLRDQQK